jgi:hypothetical protein
VAQEVEHLPSKREGKIIMIMMNGKPSSCALLADSCKALKSPGKPVQ